MNDKEEILERVYDLAFRYEAERGSCPQAVISAILETLQVGEPHLVKAVDALAGGTALSTQGTCGALVGGLVAFGSVFGRSYEEFSEGKTKLRVFRYAKKLYDRFVEEYGSPVCRDVHQKLFGRTFDFMNQHDYAAFEKMGGHVDKCPAVSGKTARWAAEIILEAKKK